MFVDGTLVGSVGAAAQLLGIDRATLWRLVKRGKGVPFDKVPHVMVRMCVAACILAMSGKLDELETE